MSAKHGGDDATSSMADIPTDVASLSDPQHELLIPDSGTAEGSPLIICFHGSGESCSPSWDALAQMLTSEPYRLRVLLHNRGELNPKPAQATAELRSYLRREGLKGPYVLIAHSYGGSFARLFLEKEEAGEEESAEADAYAPRQVAGVVLVETGQEGGLDPLVEERQYKRRVLGNRPLSVIKGNSFLRMWGDLEKAEKKLDIGDELKKGELEKRREMLGVWEKADEDMKKKQLYLAREGGTKRYVNVPDCGHNVERDRPEVVATEVAWVVENMRLGDDDDEDIEEEEEETEGGSSRSGKEKEKGWKKIGWELWKVYEKILGRFFYKSKK
ncbi:Alpha/beta hydrolase family-domain-containing protein [Annulohypoxylon bovei var. microspora]|nr:Alpha/beta hydrolase family-domain-containing protein [Annulohypoxylon bovei var. microspora]